MPRRGRSGDRRGQASGRRKIAAQITEASRLRQTAIELQDYLTQKIGEEKKVVEDASAREREAEQKIKDADANMEDANVRQHAADEQMRAAQDEIACPNSWMSRPS